MSGLMDFFLPAVFRWTAFGAFVFSLWAILFATVGYAMFSILVAIFMQMQVNYYEKA